MDYIADFWKQSFGSEWKPKLGCGSTVMRWWEEMESIADADLSGPDSPNVMLLRALGLNGVERPLGWTPVSRVGVAGRQSLCLPLLCHQPECAEA